MIKSKFILATLGAAAALCSGPELSSFFPIIGLMVAVGSTSYLRKRKLAQTVA